jgi:hypothetical protein
MGSLVDMPVPRTFASNSRRVAGAVLTLASLAAVVAGCALAQTPRTGPEPATRAAASTTASGSTRLMLRFEGHVATAILDDTAAARQLTGMLPLTLHLSDPMGQAKSGRLPASASLDVTEADRTFRTGVGELVYWSPSSTVAVIYDDLGHRVPGPGLVRLGVIDTGLADIAAGDDLTVRIDLVSESGD